MKKVSYFLMAALLVAASYVFVGCSKDNADEPSFSVVIKGEKVGEESILKGDFTSEFDADRTVSVQIVWNAPGELKEISLSLEDPTGKSTTIINNMSSGFASSTKHTWDSKEDTKCPVIMCPADKVETGCQFVFTAEVTDKNPGDKGEQKSSQKITIKFKPGQAPPPPETPLDAEKDFTWVQIPGTSTPVSGISEFGLEWKSNGNSYIKITPATGTKLVELTAEDWTTITTKEALKARVDGIAGTGLTVWEKISVGNATYAELVIATQVGNNYYIIKPEKMAVDKNSDGTINSRTVTGKSRK